MKKILIPIVSVVILAVAAVGYFLINKNQPTTNLSPTDGNGNKDVVQYAIEMDNYSFSPNLIQAQPGKDLKIKLTSKNGGHKLVIDKLGFDSGIIPSGESKIVSISIPVNASGEYDFYCGVSNHKDMGMVGKLKITNL